MAFVTHLDAPTEANRRDAERRLVNMVLAAWSGRGIPFTVIVHNISETGFRAEFSSELRVGDEVRLRLGSAGNAPAEVVWRDGWEHGCRFLVPIRPEDVKAAIETLTPVVCNEEEAQARASAPTRGWFGRREGPPRKHRGLALLIVAAFLLVEAYLGLRLIL